MRIDWLLISNANTVIFLLINSHNKFHVDRWQLNQMTRVHKKNENTQFEAFYPSNLLNGVTY